MPAGTALEIKVESPELAALEARLKHLASALGDTEPVLEALGAEIESQTRRRISEEKTSPIGEPWEPWKERYARTRHGGHSLLQGEGSLLDSIESAVRGDVAEIGTNLIYGPIQQFGGLGGMPPGPREVEARPYLGISPDNLRDLEGILTRHFDGETREALA